MSRFCFSLTEELTMPCSNHLENGLNLMIKTCYFFHLSGNDKETSLCWWHFICSVILPIATIAFKKCMHLCVTACFMKTGHSGGILSHDSGLHM